MGIIKFRWRSELGSNPGLDLAHLVGSDGTPMRGKVEIQPGLLSIIREEREAGRLIAPLQIEGYGKTMLSTASLREQAEPYERIIELARGTLNDVVNQFIDWQAKGLVVKPQYHECVRNARRLLAKAATCHQSPDTEQQAIQSLKNSLAAGRLLVDSYSGQLLNVRNGLGRRAETYLGLDLPEDLITAPVPGKLLENFSLAGIRFEWRTVVPEIGRFDWSVPDAQLRSCHDHSLTPMIGPLIDLRPHALPDWIWLWQGDFEAISDHATDLIHSAFDRFKGKIFTWNLIHRTCGTQVLGLTEEELVKLTVRLLRVARQLDPEAQILVGFDRPWADWMASGNYHLCPLIVSDLLARAELGLSGISLEIAPGYQYPGSPLRELFEFSRILDLFSCLGLPLHVSLALPSSGDFPALTAGHAWPDAVAWPKPLDESVQAEWGTSWLNLAVAKPFVNSVTWIEPRDSHNRLFVGAGLLRSDGSSKPLYAWFTDFAKSKLQRSSLD